MTAPMTRVDLQQFGLWAVVTGASSGIGKEFARQLAASGMNLTLVARRLSLLEELGNQLASQFGVQYRAVGLDLMTNDFLEKLEEATQDLDVGLVVSNAGTGNPGAFLTIDRSRLRAIVQLNVIAALNMTHHFGQKLAKRRRGACCWSRRWQPPRAFRTWPTTAPRKPMSTPWGRRSMWSPSRWG